MKKVISLIVALALIFSFCITASAAGNATLNGNTSVTAGSNVVLTLNVNGCADATSIAVSVSFDYNFELVSGTWLKSGALSKFDTSTKKGALGGLTASNVNGDVFKLVLKAKAASATAKNVSINFIAKNGSNEIMNVTPSKSLQINCSRHKYGSYTEAKENHTCTRSVCGHMETAAHTWNSGSVTKAANIPDGFGKDVAIFFVSDDGTYEKLESEVNEDGETITAKLNLFSNYAVCKLGTSNSVNTDVTSEPTEQLTESNSTLWIIIVIVAVVLIAGAVVTVIIVKKKKNNAID